ncbi:MAG TPA: zinc ribbon domain-containing protein [Wenzhouxiangellaceae bacterium]|nr:zinc ribbon domain-containing protein [Wenzhouxiangellaceae bacterium]
MPIYEYECRECSHRLEKLQKMSDAPLTHCPECGKESLTKLVSAAGFRLKGGGWYETDFKKDGKRNLAGDNGPPKSSGGGSESAGTGGGDGGKKDASKSSSESAGKSSGKASDSSGKSSGSGATSSAA